MSLNDPGYLPDWTIAGFTDPVGQLINWLWSQIQTLMSGISSGINSFVSGAISGLSSALGSLISFGNMITGAFQSFIKDPIGTIKGALDYVWSITPDFIRNPMTFIWTLASQVGTAMLGFFKDPIGVLKGLGDYIWSMVPAFIKDPLNLLIGFGQKIGAAFLTFVSDPIGQIVNAFGWIKTALDPIVSSLSGAAGKIGDLIRLPVDALSGGISAVLSGKVFDWFNSAFGQSLGSLGQIIINSILMPVQTFLDDHIFKPVVDLGKTVWEWITSNASNVASFLEADVINPIMSGINGIVSQVRAVISQMYNKIYDFFDYYGGSSPETFLSTWTSKAADLFMIPMGITALLSAAQTEVVGNKVDLYPLAELVNNSINPGILLNPIMSALTSATISIQVQRAMNSKYRTALPNLKDSYDMMREGLISEAQVYQWGSYSGYSLDLMKKYIDLWDWDPGTSDLLSWSAYMELGDDTIREVLDISRVPDTWRLFWIDMIKLRPLRNEISSLVSIIMNLRGNGLITETIFNSNLDNLYSKKYIKAKEIEIRKLQADYTYSREIIDLRVSTYQYMFRTGTINPDQLENSLLALGLDPLKANALRENELARKGQLEPEA